MADVYRAWKPLRNYLKHLDVIDGLGVIRYYSVRRSLPEKPPVPADIELHAWVDKENSFLPWELEILAREVLIVSDLNSSPTYTLRHAHDMASAMTKLKFVENYVESEYISQENVLYELSVRLAHRQFKYQTERPSTETIVRYSKIFGHPEVAPIVEEVVGLSPRKLYTLGAGAWSIYNQMLGIHHPLENLNIKEITQENYSCFIHYFSKPLPEIKSLLAAERPFDEKFSYAYNSLYAYPIILTQIDSRPTYICPLPTLLYWRITSGIYYDLVNVRGFDNAFGKAFEEYVGMMYMATTKGTRVNVYPGEPNRPSSPNRADWIIDGSIDTLLVESKTKRLTIGAKTSLLDDSELNKQLGILAAAVCQAYLSLRAYRNNTYPNPIFILPENKKAYVCVTTLERWYLMGDQLDLLDTMVKDKIIGAGLDESVLSDSPYVIIPIDDMEKVAYLSKTHSFEEIFQPYLGDEEWKRWEFGNYLNNHFKNELEAYGYIFANEINDLFTVKVGGNDSHED